MRRSMCRPSCCVLRPSFGTSPAASVCPGRVGTVRQEEMLHRLCTGHTLGTLHDELALHAELGQVMRDASICGLGYTAANAIASALPRLPLFPSVRHL